ARPPYRSLAISATTARRSSASMRSAARRRPGDWISSCAVAAGMHAAPTADKIATLARKREGRMPRLAAATPLPFEQRRVISGIAILGALIFLLRHGVPGRRHAGRAPRSARGSTTYLLLLGPLPLVAADRAVLIGVERREVLSLQHRELRTADEAIGVAVRLLEGRPRGRQLLLGTR